MYKDGLVNTRGYYFEDSVVAYSLGEICARTKHEKKPNEHLPTASFEPCMMALGKCTSCLDCPDELASKCKGELPVNDPVEYRAKQAEKSRRQNDRRKAAKINPPADWLAPSAEWGMMVNRARRH